MQIVVFVMITPTFCVSVPLLEKLVAFAISRNVLCGLSRVLISFEMKTPLCLIRFKKKQATPAVVIPHFALQSASD